MVTRYLLVWIPAGFAIWLLQYLLEPGIGAGAAIALACAIVTAVTFLLPELIRRR